MVVAVGTTGLRTWEAALHLGQYLCTDPSLVGGKRVLELGAGTGYLSILCARQLGAAHVVATDGSDEVVVALAENFALNGLQEGPDARLSAAELRWGQELMDADVDVVLGADITYDSSVVGALVTTIDGLLARSPDAEVLLAATQRNEATFASFLNTCQAQGFGVEDVSYEVTPRSEQMGPFYDDRVLIRICKVVRR